MQYSNGYRTSSCGSFWLFAGEKLSPDSSLTMIDSKDYLAQDASGITDLANSGNTTDCAAVLPEAAPRLGSPASEAQMHMQTGAGRSGHPGANTLNERGSDEDEGEEDGDGDHEPEDIEAFAADIDEKLRLLAIAPWIRAYGEVRAEEEQKIANVRKQAEACVRVYA